MRVGGGHLLPDGGSCAPELTAVASGTENYSRSSQPKIPAWSREEFTKPHP